MEKIRQELRQEKGKATESDRGACSKISSTNGRIIRKIVSSGSEGDDSQEDGDDSQERNGGGWGRMKMTDDNITNEIKL